MHIWNTIRKWFSGHIEELGVEEASFPLFLSKTSLDKEKAHVDGFAPELAWVERAYVFICATWAIDFLFPLSQFHPLNYFFLRTPLTCPPQR
jgi:hypothetical protein